ncbi:MAG: Do family serine endopeptidase, partial [Bdellovibrionales bacterium]
PGSPFEDFFEDFMDRRGLGGPAQPQASLGSGFVIDAENGIVITNNHVIRDADEVRVIFQDDETIEAEILGTDEKTDIAVLKIKTDKKLTAVKFGNSDVLRVGDWVVAIGNPFGLGGTVTAGIISARQRDINSGPYDDYLQTDASINRGNSGGPMFNLKGEVIGINTAIFSPTGGSVGIGFAIPSALAEPVVKQIINYGRTRRGWIGVRVQTVTQEIAESLGLEHATGALVASIPPQSPAEGAGLEPGDIILAFNGHTIDSMRELPRIVAETQIDSTASLKYWRDGQEKTTQIKVGELEKAEEDGMESAGSVQTGGGADLKPLGVKVKPLTDLIRKDYGIMGDVDGLVIDEVDVASEAARKGLGEGDVIVEINQQPVTSTENAQDIITRAGQNGRNSVLLLVNRDGDVSFVALKLTDQN